MFSRDGYRQNAAAVVFGLNKKVLLFKRTRGEDGLLWQFPQGGIEAGETPVEAAKRELFEETNISNVELISTLLEPLRYEFPEDVKEKFAKNGWSVQGQDQYFSLFLYSGDESEIGFDKHGEAEFSAYQWVELARAPELVWPPKREVYTKAVEKFGPVIENF